MKKRRAELNGGAPGTDYLMLDFLLQNEVEGKMLNDEEVRAEVDTMIFGAHDTSKSASAFVTYCIAKYPEVQQKVYEEAELLLGDDPEKEIKIEDLSLLVYTEAVIKESLRLYPSTPYLSRKLRSEITTGGYTFPKDVEVAFSPFLTGRDPKYFDDPLTFNPDRFLGANSNPVGFIPFSIGARKCSGSKIAIMLLKISVAKFSFNYKLSLARPDEEMKLFAELMLAPVNGILLNFEKRQNVKPAKHVIT